MDLIRFSLSRPPKATYVFLLQIFAVHHKFDFSLEFTQSRLDIKSLISADTPCWLSPLLHSRSPPLFYILNIKIFAVLRISIFFYLRPPPCKSDANHGGFMTCVMIIGVTHTSIIKITGTMGGGDFYNCPPYFLTGREPSLLPSY